MRLLKICAFIVVLSLLVGTVAYSVGTPRVAYGVTSGDSHPFIYVEGLVLAYAKEYESGAWQARYVCGSLCQTGAIQDALEIYAVEGTPSEKRAAANNKLQQWRDNEVFPALSNSEINDFTGGVFGD